MRSPSGRFTITYNGELYNYRSLRAELAGFSFRGNSDTEVLLAALERWGIDGALERCRGMFAFGLWDETEQALWLVRDRFGEKPLYYGDFGGTLVFGSELKALRQHSTWSVDIDRDALALLLRYGYIPAPHTIFRQVRKVRPGHVLRIQAQDGGFRLNEHQYWTPSALAAGAAPGEADEAQLVEGVHSALQESIRLQMVADVPVGAFLSGGIDSSLVVALMQQASTQPVRTFSIGFDVEAFNEAPYARRVAEHLGTSHTELIVTPRDGLELIGRLPQIYDEPFADPSQIPTLLVCRLAQRDVTVALSGDAGDELFGGYSRYREVQNRWHALERVPRSLRRTVARALERTPSWALSTLTAPLRAVSSLRGRQQVADRIQERAYALGAASLPGLYEAMISFWQPSSRFVIGASPSDLLEPDSAGPFAGGDALAHMMYTDTRRYLPDDILVKVDRAAMAVSLETRVPMLDPYVAEAAWRIPSCLHTKDGQGKWVLRQLLHRYVPRELFDRPKKGFAVPLESWLRGELRQWASELLEPAKMRRDGYFATERVQRRWQQHLAGKMNWSFHLWAVLMFQSWLEDFQRHAPPTQMRSHFLKSQTL